MKKAEILKVVLLGAMTIEGAICTAELVRIARNGFSIELTAQEAQKVVEAYEQAVKDMGE